MKEIKFDEKELPVIEKVIVESIKTRVLKANAKGGIVALSGGVDSSLVLVLSKKALGKNLLALIMPEKDITPEKDVEDAVKLVKKIDVDYEIIEISEFVEKFSRVLKRGEREEREYSIYNLKPRIRMIINYLYANTLNYLVIGTSNKTELLLGYGTKYGDLAADIYPIGDLYKTQVWQLAEYVGIDAEIVKKVPSAGLWKGQTDEEEIGYTYSQIDSVLYSLVDLELSVKETSLILGIPEEAVYDLYIRVVKNEHKRRPPTITKISKMCLDKDWKYPVERE
jgi:NAD+ synthase